MSAELEFKDYHALQRLTFIWGDSYDKKDWDRLRTIVAPELTVDYTGIGMQKWDNMLAADYIAMCSDPGFLGDPCVLSQHLVGGGYYERTSDTEVTGYHQIRAAHQVYTAPDLKEVKLKGHAHASNEFYYRLVDGEWKFAGLKPTVLWSEYDFAHVWKNARMDDEPTVKS